MTARSTAALRVYVAGESAESVDVIRPLIARLRAAGVEVTHDWTMCEGYDRPSTDVERAAWARQDIAGVRRADVVWYVAPHSASEGSHAELGAALALGKHLVVSGPHASRESRIFALLATQRFDTHDEALEALTRKASEPRPAWGPLSVAFYDERSGQ